MKLNIVSTSDSLLGIILGLLIGLIAAFLLYPYAKSKGALEALKNPNMIYPNIPDITITGKYRIPTQTPEEIGSHLAEWLLLNGFEYAVFPNVVKLMFTRLPPETSRKKTHLQKLELVRDGVPQEMTLFLSPSSEPDSLDVEARCVPAMYRKMGQYVQFLFPRSSVDDAKRLCTDFMKGTMHILQAKTLREPEPESSAKPTSHVEFLYNTPAENNVNERACELIEHATNRILLTGWIDREFIGHIEKAKNNQVDIRIITKSPEGSYEKTVKEDFKRLLQALGKNSIRLNSRFHDRFLVADHACILGSIYYTGASKTRFESVIYTDDVNILAKLSEHFERIWKDASSVIPS